MSTGGSINLVRKQKRPPRVFTPAERAAAVSIPVGWQPWVPCVLCGKPSARWEAGKRLPMLPCSRCRGQFCHLHRLTHLCLVGDILERLPEATLTPGAEGHVVCPGDGLCWDVATGALVRREP